MVRNDDRNSENYPLSGGAQVCNARTSFSNGLVFVASVSFSRFPPFFFFFSSSTSSWTCTSLKTAAFTKTTQSFISLLFQPLIISPRSRPTHIYIVFSLLSKDKNKQTNTTNSHFSSCRSTSTPAGA